MRFLRQALLLMLATLLTLVVTACSGGASSSTQPNLPPQSEKYDAVLASGDGYHIVMKHVDEFDGAYDMLGVVDNNGAWIHALSNDHPLIRNDVILTGQEPVIHIVGGGEVEENRKESIRANQIKQNFEYLGEAMFTLHYASNGNGTDQYMLYNAETNNGWDIGVCFGINSFHDGYMTCRTENKVFSTVKLVSRNGEIMQTGIPTDNGEVGPYCEGVFFSGVNFYRIDGSLAIDLSEYEVVNTPYFEDNKCYLELKNNGGSVYCTEIDHDGNFLYEPKQK